MRRLTASEITEPGYYWNIKAGVPVWCVREPRTGMHFRTFNGVSIAAKDIGGNLIFSKAEPPKVCRWQKASDLYIPECHGWPIGITNIEPKFCPKCGGTISIEIEESEG